MFTQLEVFKFGLYAERVHRLALDIALQATQHGNGIAVVADETRNLGVKLHGIFDKIYNNPSEKININDSILELRFLAVNCSIELLAVSGYRNHAKSTMQLAVLIDEIMNLTNDLMNLLGYKKVLPPIIPAPLHKSRVADTPIPCMIMTVNGVDFVESIRNVREVVYCDNSIENGMLSIRGMSIPLLSSLKPQGDINYCALVSFDYNRPETLFALPIDTLPTIFQSAIGVTANYKGTLPRNYIRECWDGEEDHQLVFLEYANIK